MLNTDRMDNMSSELTELRSAVHAAYTELEEAAGALDAPAADTDLDELQVRFDLADAGHKKACDAVERALRVEEARAALPVEEIAEPTVEVVSESLTYEAHAPNSIFRDLVAAQKGNAPAAARLDRHMNEMRVEKRVSSLVTGTDGDGGYLVAPLYLQDEFVALARPGRKVVDAIGTKPLPANTDSINIPTMDTGTATAAHTEAGSAQDTQAAFGTVTGAVQTIAGIQNVSQQLVDRAVPGVDQVIFSDLTRSYATQLETAVLNSSTTNSKGLLQLSGINSVTYTDASPTVAELYSKIADAVQQVQTNVYESPTHIIMHPRRWAFILAASDSTNRPLITPYAPMNQTGTNNGAAEGAVGSIQGLPVLTSSSIPTTTGAGTNQDSILVVAAPNLYIYEDASGPYLDTFRDVLSGTLQVRFRLFNYYAQINGRRPKAISAITGTGLVAPSF
jgi:HK97 family phage major capsid protein